MVRRPGYVGNPKIIALVRELRAAGMPRRDVIVYVHHVWQEHNSDRRYADHTYRSAPRYDEQIIMGSDDDNIFDGSYTILRAMRGRFSYIDNDIDSKCSNYSVPGVGSIYDDRLIQLLKQLTAEERRIVVMYYVYGYTQRDISRVMNRSEYAIHRIFVKIQK